MAKLRKILSLLPHWPLLPKRGRRPGQSYVELALILPILVLMLLGLVEVVVFIGRYLDIIDLTREAARFGSIRDPFEITEGKDAANKVDPRWDLNCWTQDKFDFYFDTSCIFAPPAGSSVCDTLSSDNPFPDTPLDLRQTFLTFCNGLNTNATYDPRTDDVIVSVYTLSNNTVTNAWPWTGRPSKRPYPTNMGYPNGFWALSDHDAYLESNGNWQKDCQGNVIAGAQPYYNKTVVEAAMRNDSSPSKGYVAVEYFYCHKQVLGIPIFTSFVPNPIRIHAYTLMPLPAAQPTPTPALP